MVLLARTSLSNAQDEELLINVEVIGLGMQSAESR